MQNLGSKELEQQTSIFFKYLNLDPKEFPKEEKEATLYTFYRLLEMEGKTEPERLIEINKVKYYAKDNLLDMPLKFLIELANIEVEEESFEYYHAFPSLIYRKDWSLPYSEKEHIEGQELFYKLPLEYSIWGYQLFNELIVTLQENYPVLYQGEKGGESDGRKMYDMLKMLANNDFTKMEKAEQQPIWRAFTWMEQQKHEQLANANVR